MADAYVREYQAQKNRENMEKYIDLLELQISENNIRYGKVTARLKNKILKSKITKLKYTYLT